MSWNSISLDAQSLLLDVAFVSLAAAVRTGTGLEVDADEYPDEVRRGAASFVTLRIGMELRGCMGSVQAERPLVADVARNAYSAGFRDPRFSPLTGEELQALSVRISVLSPPEPVAVDSERELLAIMQDREHGWILQLGQRRGLLLPAVWKSVDDPREFLEHLKTKAELRPEFWSREIVVERFTAVSFGPRGCTGGTVATRRKPRFLSESLQAFGLQTAFRVKGAVKKPGF